MWGHSFGRARAQTAHARARIVCLHHVDKVTVKATEKERLVFTFFSKRIFGAGISKTTLCKYRSGGLVMHHDMSKTVGF